MCHVYTKEFVDLNFKQVLKNNFFKLPQNSHIYKNCKFEVYGNWKEIDQLLLLRQET